MLWKDETEMEDVIKILKSPYFNSRWYKEKYMLNINNAYDLARHYLEIGASKGYDPGESFSTREYYFENPQVQNKGGNPLVDLSENKERENKSSSSDFFCGKVPGFNCNDCWMEKTILTVEAPVKMKKVKLKNGKISIGAFTYLGENCLLRGNISIGRMCSIAENVVIWNANHFSECITTHSILLGATKSWTKDYAKDIFKKSSIALNKSKCREIMNNSSKVKTLKVGNDVWIGNGVKILQGVEIGNGAIVGAGSVVTKDVPQYSIVAGNPAKIIRYRFEKEEIECLQKLSWWKYGPDILADLDDCTNVKRCVEICKRIKAGYPEYKSKRYKIDGINHVIDKL